MLCCVVCVFNLYRIWLCERKMVSLFWNSAMIRGRDEVYAAAMPLRGTKRPPQLLMSAAYSLNLWDFQHFMVIIKPSSLSQVNFYAPSLIFIYTYYLVIELPLQFMDKLNIVLGVCKSHFLQNSIKPVFCNLFNLILLLIGNSKV